MGLLTQFTLLLWKNFTLRKRQKVHLCSPTPFADQRISAKNLSAVGVGGAVDVVPGLSYQGQLSYSWVGEVIGGIYYEDGLLSR